MIGRPYHSDPGLNHGDPRGVPGARLPDPLDALDPARIATYLDRFFDEDIDAGRDQDAARAQRRLAGELLGQLRAEGVGREVRGAPPERGRARSVVASSAATTRRPTASSTRSSSSRGDAVRGAPRHRRQQAGRLDQDPRQDLRPRAEAPRGAPRGRGASGSGELEHAHRQEAPRAARAASRQQLAARKQQDPALERADRRDRASALEAYEAPPSTPRRSRPRASSSCSKKTSTTGTSSRAFNRDARNHSGDHRATTETDDTQEEPARSSARKARRPDIDVEAELQQVRGRAERKRLGLDAEHRALGRRHGRPDLHRRASARTSRSSSAA